MTNNAYQLRSSIRIRRTDVRFYRMRKIRRIRKIRKIRNIRNAHYGNTPSGDAYEMSHLSNNFIKILINMLVEIFVLLNVYNINGLEVDETWSNIITVPRYNESCPSPDNAQLCENACYQQAMDCNSDCNDQGNCSKAFAQN